MTPQVHEVLLQRAFDSRIDQNIVVSSSASNRSESIRHDVRRGQLMFVPCLYNIFRKWQPSPRKGTSSSMRSQALPVASPRSILRTSTLWRVYPDSPATSRPESSLLEKEMRGRHQFSNESAIPSGVRIITALVHREFVNGYDLVPGGTSDLSSSS